MEDFYSRLSYSFGNEDWITEQKALQIKPSDAIVCVTASGDRPLNLLTEECKSIISVDANPMQNALLDLKKAAIAELDYSSYLAFLGVEPTKGRMESFNQLSYRLDNISRRLWNRHKGAIRKGVLFQGAIERRIKIVNFLIKLTRSSRVKRLFTFDNLEEQTRFVKKKFDTFLWRRCFDVALHPRVTRLFVQDPGLYQYVDPEIHIGHYIHDRLHGALSQFLAKESMFLSLLLQGKIDQNHFPPYLEEESLKKIRPRLDRLQFATADLITYLENAPENSFDCFSLSDVASYIPREDFERMIRAVQRCARPGARFCIRQFMTKYELPEKLAHHFERNRKLEEELTREDRCFVYHFMVGTVKKG
ncbi:MAG: DUF3419 family protein [Chlamydiales bacterium]|nr:DUF3419 family protein [Chlamydiales bacterium]